jgi:mono/diheme cytochrome c family protein
MNQSVKRFATSGSGPLLLALLLVELTVIGAIPPQRRRSSAKVSGAERVGDLFRSNCARCHGADGRGDTPLGHTYNAPDFTDGEWWRKHSEFSSSTRLISIVTRGKGGMPAFGKKLRRNDIKLLVDHVRRFRKQP